MELEVSLFWQQDTLILKQWRWSEFECIALDNILRLVRVMDALLFQQTLMNVALIFCLCSDGGREWRAVIGGADWGAHPDDCRHSTWRPGAGKHSFSRRRDGGSRWPVMTQWQARNDSYCRRRAGGKPKMLAELDWLVLTELFCIIVSSEQLVNKWDTQWLPGHGYIWNVSSNDSHSDESFNEWKKKNMFLICSNVHA